MTRYLRGLTRRQFIKGSVAVAGAGALCGFPQRAFAAYPDRTIRVVIPTEQGGSADRLARTFCNIWKKFLGVNFEYDFFPGASGQVGYETYIGRKERDGYNLLFGNVGAEMIMYTLRNPKYKFPDDNVYFCRVDVDDSCLFVRSSSPFRKIEDVVAEGKKRAITTATSRIPHPASIGALALGEETGAKFNLVPYAGGNPTIVAVLNGEADCGVLPMANPISMLDRIRILTVFNDENKLANLSGNAPPVNKVFGTKIPDLYSSRAWAIHTTVVQKYPDRFEKLNKTARQVFDDPAYKEGYLKTGAPFETISYGDHATCTKYALGMVDLTNRFKGILGTAK
ncbi:MAG: substrate-binding domain-containing protein [Thermodesulfobacteriota bacterium]|nr:substrate-binding domain-containing protein [Thermodesulfobacteriota bacterium]